MAATATAGPRYAPEDPTLPKPWRGLVDGKTGYLYFWNPVTNVTQYEKPGVSSQADSVPLHKSASVSVSSSVEVQQSSQGLHCDTTNDDDGCGRGSNGGSKLDSGARNFKSESGGSDHSNNIPNGAVDAVQGGSSGRGYGSSAAVGGGASAESYCHRHEITVTGDNVPPPFTSFEATGLPSEILREVRYLFQEELNVVRCAALFSWGLHKFGAPLNGGPIMEGFPNLPSSWRGCRW